MKVARTLILLLMAWTILPWNGFLAAVAAPYGVIMVDQAEEAKLSAPRQCRGSFLPGAECAPERWLHAVTQVVWREGAGVIWTLRLNLAVKGQVHAPPQEPPRMI